jgi:hypothetical protein
MASGIASKVDYVFKRLFGDEDNALLLVDLLNTVLNAPCARRCHAGAGQWRSISPKRR